MSAGTSVELELGGMTCASCAVRIEKRLNRLDGVAATVNYATEKARVSIPEGFDTARLVVEVEKSGYSAVLPTPPRATPAAPDAELRSIRRRLVLAVALAVPVIALAMIPAWQFAGWQWVSLALATPVVWWAGWPFHRAAAINLRHGAATMDTLISLGTVAAYLWSVYALVFGTAGMIGMTHGFEWFSAQGGAEGIYLEVAAGVTMFVLVGRYAELRAKRQSGAALRALLALGAKDVAVLREGVEHRVPVADLGVGDEFVVRPGETIAADGIVRAGSSTVDRSLLTGEAVPEEVGEGDVVVGGTLNTSGRLVVRATRVGADTQLARIARLVDEAQSGKAAAQRLADRVSAVFVPIVIALSLGTLVAWLLLGFPAASAFTAAVAVLIIACPCALGLATPTALLVGTGRGSQLGILIRGPEVLESTRRVDTVVLDKTGTVTEGRMRLVDVHPAAGESRAEVLRLAASLEDASEHPVAQAIAAAAVKAGHVLAPVDSFVARAGLGVEGTVEGRALVVGREPLLAAWALRIPDDLARAKAQAEAAGRTAVIAAWDGDVRGLLVVSDEVKATSRAAVAALRALGLRPILLTGDNAAAARRVADEVGIDTVVAEVLPEDKVAAIEALQREGRVVAMVGDGVNDAAALARADLGIAMGTGADAAIEASDLTLVRGDLMGAVDAIRLSRRTLSTIRTNLFWAFAYNTAAIPLAALGLLNPMLAGAAMAFSSVFVVGNSLRLRSFRAARAPHTPREPA